MNTKNKKRIIIIVSILLVVAIAVAGVLFARSYLEKEEVTLNTISTESIYETVSATGAVTSGASVEYKVGAIATVKEVFVKVGDRVNKGDILATFDTSSIDQQIASMQGTYDDALASYNEAVASNKEAQAKLNDVNLQIANLENEIARLEKDVTVDNSSIDEADALVSAVDKISQIASNFSVDTSQAEIIVNIVVDEVKNTISQGEVDVEILADNVKKALQTAIDNGTINISDAGKMIDEIVVVIKAIDFDALVNDVKTNNSVDLVTKKLELAVLNAQKNIYSLTANGSYLETQEKLVDTAKSALDTIKASKQQLAAGWVASVDGVITECNIVAGAQTSLLTTGIKLENMDTMTATISLTEYDVHKVKVGMPAKITTAYGSYEGEVATVAPVATGGGGSSILDSVGSIAGISGLSSLTQSGAGVECTVTVLNPDNYIIVGFDADVEIQVGEHIDVPCVPIESIILEKTGTYVYKYNEVDSTVTKTMIKTGAVSDSSYEITNGLEIGDKIVATPSTMYEEETFDVRVVDKLSTDKK